MSADNWAVCPRCTERRREHLAEMDAAVAAAYGTVPAAEYERIHAERAAFAAESIEPTFREDYEFWGAEDGVLNINYSGACQKCGLAHQFKHTETLDLGGTQ